MNKKYSKIILAVMSSCHQILKQPIGNWLNTTESWKHLSGCAYFFYN